MWKGEAERVSFVPVNSGSVEIKTIQVSYEKVQPKSVSLAVSSAERATLYYSDRSFIIPEGIVARTYKIEGNVLSRSREYKREMFFPRVQLLFWKQRKVSISLKKQVRQVKQTLIMRCVVRILRLQRQAERYTMCLEKVVTE